MFCVYTHGKREVVYRSAKGLSIDVSKYVNDIHSGRYIANKSLGYSEHPLLSCTGNHPEDCGLLGSDHEDEKAVKRCFCPLYLSTFHRAIRPLSNFGEFSWRGKTLHTFKFNIIHFLKRGISRADDTNFPSSLLSLIFDFWFPFFSVDDAHSEYLHMTCERRVATTNVVMRAERSIRCPSRSSTTYGMVYPGLQYCPTTEYMDLSEEDGVRLSAFCLGPDSDRRCGHCQHSRVRYFCDDHAFAMMMGFMREYFLIRTDDLLGRAPQCKKKQRRVYRSRFVDGWWQSDDGESTDEDPHELEKSYYRVPRLHPMKKMMHDLDAVDDPYPDRSSIDEASYREDHNFSAEHLMRSGSHLINITE